MTPCNGWIFGMNKRGDADLGGIARCVLPVDHEGGCLPPQAAQQMNTPHYPHKCPRCGGAAYVGFTDFDCSRGCK